MESVKFSILREKWRLYFEEGQRDVFLTSSSERLNLEDRLPKTYVELFKIVPTVVSEDIPLSDQSEKDNGNIEERKAEVPPMSTQPELVQQLEPEMEQLELEIERLKNEMEQQLDPEIDQLEPNLEPQLKSQQLEAEMEQQLVPKLEPQLKSQLDKQFGASFIQQLEPEMEQQLVPKIEQQLRSQFEQKFGAGFVQLESEMEQQLVPKVEQQLKSQVEQQFESGSDQLFASRSELQFVACLEQQLEPEWKTDLPELEEPHDQVDSEGRHEMMEATISANSSLAASTNNVYNGDRSMSLAIIVLICSFLIERIMSGNVAQELLDYVPYMAMLLLFCVLSCLLCICKVYNWMVFEDDNKLPPVVTDPVSRALLERSLARTRAGLQPISSTELAAASTTNTPCSPPSSNE